MQIRPLQARDVDAALRLSTLTGWNQIEADWRRMLTLRSVASFGGFIDEQLIATATLVKFGDAVAWVGMMLVDPAYRGRGVGGRMLEHVLDTGTDGCVVGLDATDMGRPVYEKRGFVEHSRVNRWIGDVTRSQAPAWPGTDCVRSPEENDWPQMIALDRCAVDVERESVLRQLASEPGATVRVAMMDQRIAAVGFARRGRERGFIGPVVGESVETALATVGVLIDDRRRDGDQTVFIDVPQSSALAERLAERGFALHRKLARMTRPAVRGNVMNGPAVHAGAGFEFG